LWQANAASASLVNVRNRSNWTDPGHPELKFATLKIKRGALDLPNIVLREVRTKILQPNEVGVAEDGGT
jgi:hypothetical protein